MKRDAFAALFDYPGHFTVGANRNRGFGDHHQPGLHGIGDFFRCLVNIGQIRVPVTAPRGCANGDESRAGAFKGGCQIFGKRKPPGLNVHGHQTVQPRLVYRHLAAV